MFNLIPQWIVERMETGERQGKFVAGAVFVDLSGFTLLTENLLPYGQAGVETLVNVLDALFAPLIQVIYAYGGFITTFAGDALTAVFPAPTPVEQAVAAGWHIQQAIGDGRQSTPYGDFTFAARVGVAVGEVRWDIVTAKSGQRALYYFQGSAIDRCAAAERLAQVGDIVITPEVYRAIQLQITATPLEDHYRLTRAGNLPRIAQPAASDFPTLPPPYHLFYPPEVLNQTHRGEFRHVFSLFISLPDARTPTQLASFVQIVFALQNQYGGLLNHLDFGDKGCYLLLFWGAPVSHENDGVRALRFALELQTRSSLPLKIGITYRLAYAGFVGTPQRGTYTCYSQGVNLAARFMTSAPLGNIWLDERTAHLAQPHFDLEFLGGKSFKGFPESQSVYRLLEHKEEVEFSYQGPFVGRETELMSLAQFVQPLAEGRSPGLCLIWGEAGMGKSRLIHTFQATTPLRPLPVLWALCQTDQIVRQPLNPFRYWLHHYFEQSTAHSEASNKRSFNRKLDQLIAATTDPALQQELNRVRSLLGAMVDLFWPDSLYAELNPQGRLDNSFLALTALAQAESRRQPLILHIEDAHWLDSDSRAFLIHLTSRIANYPIALLVTARPDGETALLLPETIIQQQISLPPMPHQEMETVISHLVSRTLIPEMLASLVQRAEGNPFFAEQIVLYLDEQKWIQMGIEPAALETILPRDIRALLVARLDRLTQEVKEVVQTAAILGREFEVQILSFMLQSHSQMPSESLHHQLIEAEQQTIWSALTAIRYLFRHTLMRDAAYELQLLQRRRALHGLAITALETIYGDDLGPHYTTLAYHAAQSQDIAKQRLYYRLAGEAAQAIYANDTAITHYKALIPLLSISEQSPVYRELGHLAEMTGHWEEAKSFYQQAVQCAEGHDHRAMARAQADLGDLLSDQGDYVSALSLLRQALQIFTEFNDAQGMSNTLYQIGEIAWRQNHYQEAKTDFEKSLAISQAAGEQKQIASAFSGLGIVAEMEGDYPQSVALYQEALTIYHQMGNKYGKAVMLNNLGIGQKNLGNYRKAMASFQESLALKREMGNRTGVAITLNNLGEVALQQGDISMAEQFFQESLAIKQDIGQKRGQAITLSGLSQVASFRGNYDEARRYLNQSLALYQELQDRRGILYGLAAWVSLGVKSGASLHAIVRLGSAVEAMLRSLNTTLDPEDHHLFAEALGKASEQLGNEIFNSLWAEGHPLSLDDALALVEKMETPHE